MSNDIGYQFLGYLPSKHLLALCFVVIKIKWPLLQVVLQTIHKLKQLPVLMCVNNGNFLSKRNLNLTVNDIFDLNYVKLNKKQETIDSKISF